ncbi:hypothetical protein NGRA_0078 [Nosema granulosis]|uniref:Uncharacterized protein n=1 Tax=Nosema granulosis TaxID=83296 RepID=A0A9P6L0C9_9MICR|nr:hypothetical protein NGRA_0078 [Nosema granulosis]
MKQAIKYKKSASEIIEPPVKNITIKNRSYAKLTKPVSSLCFAFLFILSVNTYEIQRSILNENLPPTYEEAIDPFLNGNLADPPSYEEATANRTEGSVIDIEDENTETPYKCCLLLRCKKKRLLEILSLLFFFACIIFMILSIKVDSNYFWGFIISLILFVTGSILTNMFYRIFDYFNL